MKAKSLRVIIWFHYLAVGRNKDRPQRGEQLQSSQQQLRLCTPLRHNSIHTQQSLEHIDTHTVNRSILHSTCLIWIVKTNSIPEGWYDVRGSSLKWLILTEAAAEYYGGQGGSAAGVWWVTGIMITHKICACCMCICWGVFVYLDLTWSGLIRDQSCVMILTADSTHCSSGDDCSRTAAWRANSTTFWTQQGLCKYYISACFHSRSPHPASLYCFLHWI